jgi:hypothetical protein
MINMKKMIIIIETNFRVSTIFFLLHVVFVFIAISIDHFTLRLIKQVKKFIVIKGPFFYSNISLLLSLLLFLFYSFMMDMEKIAKDKL